MNYLYAASGSLILLFIFLILKKPNHSRADYLLIALNLLIGAFMLGDILVNWRLTSLTVIFQNAVPLFLFPTFTFYVLQYTHGDKPLALPWYLTLLPGLSFLGLSFVDHFVLNSYPDPIAIEQHFNEPSIWYQLIFKGSQLLFIGLLSWLLRALNQFEQQLKEGYSSIETIDVNWLKHFTWIYLGSIIATFVLFLSQNLGFLPLDIKQVFGIIYGVLVLSVFYLNYQGIQHYTLSQVASPGTSPSTPKLAKPKREPKLSQEDLALEAEILTLIKSEQLYLSPHLSLDDLAEKLGKSRHLVSKAINAKEGRTFYDLINGLRVAHLQKLLKDPANTQYTILALGLDSGFNSKASLNRIFKKMTGLTPKQYHEQGSQLVQ